MRTTVTLDDDLVAKAQKYTGIQEKSALIRLALEALVRAKPRAHWRGLAGHSRT